MKNSRRQFLKIASLSFLGLAGSQALPAFVKAAEAEKAPAPAAQKPVYQSGKKALHAKHWGMVIDTRKFDNPEIFAAVIAAHAWEALFGDEELGLALNRTMHTDQGFTFHRPLRAGDVVEAQLSIEKVRNRGNLDMITVVVDLVVDGETVCEARSGLMHTREDAHA